MGGQSAEQDHATAGRVAAALVREGLRPRLATRLAYALLPTIRDLSSPPAQTTTEATS